MSNPRVVIARAIAASNIGYDAWNELTGRDYRRYSEMADAVIDALEGMEPTEAMRDAYSNINGIVLDDDAWRAMIGAMRDE